MSAVGLMSGLVAVTVWIFMTDFLSVSDLYAIIGAVLATLFFAGLLSLMVADRALIPTDFLARSILLVTREDSQVEAPDPADLSAGRQFLSGLAQSVYQLAAADSQIVKSSSKELPFYRSLVNAIPLPVMVLDKDRQITFANESALHYISLPASDVIAKQFYDCLDLCL